MAQTIVDDVVHDLQNCEPVMSIPTLSDYEVSGSGGITGCAFAPFGFTVCLDWSLQIQPHSCVPYMHPDTSGPTNSIPCVPGVWATTVIIHGPQSPDETALGYLERHSNPAIIVKDCVRPPGVRP
jgi:hypothetical protein